jgi:hypothetical protein
VVVTWSGQNASNAGLILLSVPRLVSATQDDFNSPLGKATDNWSHTVGVTSLGVVIGSSTHLGGFSQTLGSWSGLTARDSITLGGTAGYLNVAFDSKMPTETNHTVGISWANTVASGFQIASYHQ